MSNMLQFEWFLGGDSILFDGDPYVVSGMEGFDRMVNRSITTRGQGQVGELLTGVQTSGRNMAIELTVINYTEAEFWGRREALVKALVGGDDLGLLRIYRDGEPDVEIECMPTTAPDIRSRALMLRIRISLFAPSPWFVGTSDRVEYFETSGGITIPDVGEPSPGLEITAAGISIGLNSEQLQVQNDGHVPAPVKITINGEVDTPYIEQLNTGKEMRINGPIGASEKIEVNTAYGEKRVELVDNTGRHNAFARLDQTAADFIQLTEGQNTIRSTFGVNYNGSMSLVWRERYAGL